MTTSAPDTTPKPEMLHVQYPDVYRLQVEHVDFTSGETTFAPEKEHWFPVPDGLIGFLMSRVSPAAAVMILAIRSACSHENFVEAKISDDKLAVRAGIDPKTVYRIRQTPEFLELVYVTEGLKRSKGSGGRSTAYNLTPLMTAYRRHRRRSVIGLDLVEEGMTVVQETRARAKAMAKYSGRNIAEPLMWASRITDDQIAAALEKNRNDPACAAEALIRELRPEGVERLEDALDSMSPDAL